MDIIKISVTFKDIPKGAKQKVIDAVETSVYNYYNEYVNNEVKDQIGIAKEDYKIANPDLYEVILDASGIQ